MHYQKRLNPYNKNRSNEPHIFKKVIQWFGLGFAVLLAIGVISILPLWQIKTVEMSGSVAPGVSMDAVLRNYFAANQSALYSARNIWYLKSSTLHNALETAYGTDKITIDKNFPSTISITVSDPGASTVFVTRGKSYALDSYGKIVGPVHNQAPNAVIIYDSGAVMPAVGAEVLRPEFLQFLASVERHDAFRGYRIKYALSPSASDSKSATLALDKGFRIMIDPTANLTEQLNRMNRIISQVVGSAKLSTLDYIDLRFKEKVFYKTK